MKWVKWIIPLTVAVAFLAALFMGIRRFGLPDSYSTVAVLEEPWEYRTDTGESGEIYLPWVAFLAPGTKEIRLTTTLPEWEGEAYALHFTSMEQTVEVLVDGKSRYLYGTSTDAEDFIYRSAHHINQVALKQSDSGRKITIVYRAPALFITELGLLREVRIGTMGDLVLYQFGKSVPYFFISFFTILIILAALVLLTTYKGMPLRGNLSVLLLAVCAVLFFNSENTALWSVFCHSAVLSALIDWTFYYLDPVIHFTAWASMYAAGWKFRGNFRRWIPLVLGICYSVAAVLSMAGVFNFNLTRPFFMTVGFIFTLFLVKDHIRRPTKERPESLAFAVLVLLTGYYLDYIKYCLMILPVSAQWSVFLQLKLPFQFFTGIALVAFSALALRITMAQLARREAENEVKSATALLQAKYAKQQYEDIVQRDKSLRSLNHDMRFHFRTVAAFLADGQTEEAERYLAKFGDMLKSVRHSPWCADYVSDITIGWYAERFLQHNIPFTVTANIPALKEDAHADMSCILSNALQNALEGCEGQEEPFVRLLARKKGGQLLLRIENRCDRMLSPAGEKFLTTKSGKGHGLGISSMEAAAYRQNGYLKVCAQDGVFRVDVVLCGVFAVKTHDGIPMPYGKEDEMVNIIDV